ncbi:MAG: hypothetical protein HY749_10250 [Gammaproteobacteria bacterium]|nr:hypothetical protein [Gammaproteobacteria bacterium]
MSDAGLCDHRRGIGNSRGEVARDPAEPLAAAEALGRRLFERRYTDYRIDTPRSGRVRPAVQDIDSSTTRGGSR